MLLFFSLKKKKRKEDDTRCSSKIISDANQPDLASIVMDDETLVPAVEVFMCVDLDSELLQHGLVGSLTDCVHGGAHVVQNAHYTGRILGSQRRNP